MQPSLRRLHLSTEILSMVVIAASVALFSHSVAGALWQRFADEEKSSLARALMFLENQLDDRLALFSPYADDALRGIEPSAPDDVDLSAILSTSTLTVLEVLPSRRASTFFPGYSLMGSAPGWAFVGLGDGQQVHSGVIRSPERDGPAVYYAKRRGNRLAVAVSGVDSIAKVLGRISDLAEGGFALASPDGFVLVNAVQGIPATVRYPGDIEDLRQIGEWYVSGIRAEPLGGILYKFSPARRIDTLVVVIRLAGIPVALLLLGFAFARYLAEHRYIIGPLEKLAEGLASWPERPLETGRVMAKELSTVYEAFKEAQERIGDSMDSLSRAKFELEQSNAELESRVEARTEGLNSALDTLTRVQDKLVAQEKMAVLGRMAAGVAHELNTPLGAILSAAGSVQGLLSAEFASWALRTRGLPEESLALLAELLAPQPDDSAFDTASSRTHARELLLWLKEKGLACERHMASGMAELGLRAGDSLAANLAVNPDANLVLSLALEASSAGRSISLIKKAAESAARVVSALRSYSWEGGGELRPVDIAAQLGNVCTIMRDKLKRGYDLRIDIPPGLYAMADPDRLSQVWINLINNALQAMGTRGTLSIRGEKRDGAIRVAIQDDGPGIPPDIGPTIFEPFFTTKAQGEGTGLGLDICRRIVSTAGGRIHFESVPGATTFYVELPCAEAAGARQDA